MNGLNYCVSVLDDIAVLAERYLAKRRLEVSSLETWLRDGAFDALVSAGHRVAGSGAAYGFDTLSDFARELESAAQRQDADACGQLIGHMSAYLARVQLHILTH